MNTDVAANLVSEKSEYKLTRIEKRARMSSSTTAHTAKCENTTHPTRQENLGEGDSQLIYW